MKNITVIGAGTMGNGIAQVFAQSGYQVILNDISNEVLEKAIQNIKKNLDRLIEKEKLQLVDKENCLQNLTTSSDTQKAVANVY
jgi:3-hydroxybutyryl-CoA dehydrogenase